MGITDQDKRHLEMEKEEISSTGTDKFLYIDETGTSTEQSLARNKFFLVGTALGETWVSGKKKQL